MPTSQDAPADQTKLNVKVPQLLLMHNRQERTTLTLYNFRTLVSLGVLGFVYHTPEFHYDLVVKGALTLGFIIFSIGNGLGAIASQKITVSISDALKNVSDTYDVPTKNVLLAHAAVSVSRMKLYQWSLTAIVLIAIWFPNLRKL